MYLDWPIKSENTHKAEIHRLIIIQRRTLVPLGCVILYTSERGSGHLWNILTNVKVIATRVHRITDNVGFGHGPETDDILTRGLLGGERTGSDDSV
jgi:hypothetical protein